VPTGRPAGRGGAGTEGAQSGGNVALVWTDPDQPGQDHWDRMTVGEVVLTAAADVAAIRPEYSELTALGQTEILVVMLTSSSRRSRTT
jgi:hypothetical protein